jgi:hypothetical protein
MGRMKLDKYGKLALSLYLADKVKEFVEKNDIDKDEIGKLKFELEFTQMTSPGCALYIYSKDEQILRREIVEALHNIGLNIQNGSTYQEEYKKCFELWSEYAKLRFANGDDVTMLYPVEQVYRQLKEDETSLHFEIFKNTILDSIK